MILQKMMDHLEDRPRDYHWDICQNNVVKYLLSKWGMEDDGFTEEEVNHVIGQPIRDIISFTNF